MTFTLYLTFAAFFISLAGTRLLILAFRNNPLLLDRPNARSNHKNPTPRGGGLAVIFAILIPMMIADVPIYIAISILLLAAIALLDDLLGVPVFIRFAVQIIAVSIPLAFVPDHLLSPLIPPLLEKIMLGIAWVWMINLFNFMDGIDGISAAELTSVGLGATFIMVFINLFPSSIANYGMIVAASACGFWWWNKHPARIFLGDVGSIPLGFILGYLLLTLLLQGYWVAAMILPAYYVSDSSVTLFKRLYRKQKIWQAHSEHYYQKAARKGWKHNIIVRYIVGLNMLLGFLAVYSTLTPELDILFIGLAYMATFMLMGFFAHENKPSIILDKTA